MIKPEFKNIPIEFLKPGKYQTMRVFDQKILQEFAESIKSKGLIQPIIVRRVIKGANSVNYSRGCPISPNFCQVLNQHCQ